MTCAESRDLMLMRKGELTKGQEDELRRHVKTCAGCAAHMQVSKDMRRKIESLRLYEPILKNPQALTSGILNAVENERRTRNAANAAASSSGRVFGFLSYRAARIVYGMFVLGSVGLFLAQQISLATDVQSLEEKLVMRRDEKSRIQVMYSVPSNLVNRVPNSKQILSYLGTEAGGRNGNFVIDGESLSKAIEAVGNVIFPNAFSDDMSRTKLETIAETIQRSASARVTIRSKEPL